jgi:hypothetical protein
MNTSTLPRLVFFTLAVLAGAAAILTDRFFVPGIMLIGFSSIILMSNREQKKHWSTPLTKWQIVRGFIPLILILSFIAYLMIAREPVAPSSEPTVTSITDMFKVVFVIAVVFMIGQPWLRWYRARNAAGAPSQSD